jgi:hypothetical protein
MNNLSPSAQQLVRAGAKAARPSEADRARLFEALRGRLGDSTMLGEPSAAVSRSAARAASIKLSALTVGLALFVGGVVVALRTGPRSSTAPSMQLSRLPEQIAPVASVVSEPESIPAADSPSTRVEPVAPPASAIRRSSDRLAQEVALLSRATSALRSGRPAEALVALSEHQSQFPKGVLAEERRAARAQALCALGRRAEAESELARLAQTAPQSPQTARAREVCGGR